MSSHGVSPGELSTDELLALLVMLAQQGHVVTVAEATSARLATIAHEPAARIGELRLAVPLRASPYRMRLNLAGGQIALDYLDQLVELEGNQA